MEELLKILRITEPPIESENGVYVIDLADSDEFSKMYSRLNRCGIVDEVDEASQNTLNPSIQFANDDFNITLNGDLETEEYKLIIKETR